MQQAYWASQAPWGEGGDLPVNCRPGCHSTGYLLLKQGRCIEQLLSSNICNYIFGLLEQQNLKARLAHLTVLVLKDMQGMACNVSVERDIENLGHLLDNLIYL